MASRIDLRGVGELERLLRDPDFVRDPLGRAVERSVRAAARSVQTAAARRTGTMAASVGARVEAEKGAELAAVVEVKATSRGGTSYPSILEYSRRYGHEGEMRDGLERAADEAEKALAAAGDAIERK